MYVLLGMIVCMWVCAQVQVLQRAVEAGLLPGHALSKVRVLVNLHPTQDGLMYSQPTITKMAGKVCCFLSITTVCTQARPHQIAGHVTTCTVSVHAAAFLKSAPTLWRVSFFACSMWEFVRLGDVVNRFQGCLVPLKSL